MKFSQLSFRTLAVLTLILAPQAGTAEIQNLIIQNVVITTQGEQLSSDLANSGSRDGSWKLGG